MPKSYRFNRQDFEELTQEVLQHPDLRDIPGYYRDPASGFWILESGDKYVGLIAIDSTQLAKDDSKEDKKAPKTAVLRHFHVEEPYRKVKAQDDLLKFAIDHAFKSDPKLERIEAKDSPLIPYLRDCLRAQGFELDHHTKQVGLRKWKLGVRYLERERWTKNQKA